MKAKNDMLVSIYELARAAKITPHHARQLIIAEVIRPSTHVKRGTLMQPVFLESDLESLVDAIRKHQKEMAA